MASGLPTAARTPTALASLTDEYAALGTPSDVDRMAWANVEHHVVTMEEHVRDMVRLLFLLPASPMRAKITELAVAINDDMVNMRVAHGQLLQMLDRQRANLEHFLVGAILYQTTGRHELDTQDTPVSVPMPSAVPSAAVTEEEHVNYSPL